MGCAASVNTLPSFDSGEGNHGGQPTPDRRRAGLEIMEDSSTALSANRRNPNSITGTETNVEPRISSSYGASSQREMPNNQSSFFHGRPSPPLRLRSRSNQMHEEHAPSNIDKKPSIQTPPALDLSCLPAPKFNYLDATPTLDEKPQVPYYCPICFVHTDSIFSCVSCRHHLCAKCLLQMTKEYLKRDKGADLLTSKAIKTFAKALPGSTVELTDLISCCPHCRDDCCRFKRITRSDLYVNCHKNVRTYVDSPRTQKLLLSKQIEDTSAKLIRSAVCTAMASIQASERPESEEVNSVT